MNRLPRASPVLIVFAFLFLVSSVFLFHHRVSHDEQLAILRNSKFASGQRPPPPDNSKHLVIASYKWQNVGWLDQVPSSWKALRYFTDDPSPANNLSVPNWVGREAMVYLTYIIDHYDDLPDYTVFVHGHRRSWHQAEPLPWKVRGLNLTALENEGFIQLRCEDKNGCDWQPFIRVQESTDFFESRLPDFWRTIVADQPVPRYLSHKCCAQFAVTRAAIRQHPIEFWERVRSPLMLDLAELKKTHPWADGSPDTDNWWVGMFYERIWHLLFTGQEQVCPPAGLCRREHFSNSIICSGSEVSDTWNRVWRDVPCTSAFEGVPPDEEPDWEAWYKTKNLWDASARVSMERHNRWW